MTTNKVVKQDGKWYVKSEDGKKNLGGPYDSEDAANKRLEQVEHFKQNQLQSITANLTPRVRYDTLEGRKHLVVPMVMLTEGVHAGSNGPLYYDAEELGKTPVVWNGRPIVIYHPTQDGQAISAGDPTVFNTRKVGVVMGTVYEGGKLKSEAWLDEERLGQVDDRVLKAIQNGRPMEISTGLFTDNDDVAGEWKGEKYKSIARNFRPDHLAILPDQKGACSLADGAGLLRNQAVSQSSDLDAAYRALGQALQLVKNELSQGDIVQKLSVLLSDEAASKGNRSGTDTTPITPAPWPNDVFDSWFTYTDNGKMYARDYKKEGDNITLVGLPREVVRVTTYKTIDGQIVGNQRRNKMDKTKVVSDLIANADSPWDEEDRWYLTAMPEEKLEKLIPVANEFAPAKPKDLTPAEEKEWDKLDGKGQMQWLKDRKAPTKDDDEETMNEEQPLTLDEYIQKAPEELQEVLNSSLALHREQKGKLIATITANKANRFPQQVLASKSLNELQAIAALAAPSKKPVNNYSGMADAGAVNTAQEEPLVAPVMNFNRD